jgi:hypothetical protein
MNPARLVIVAPGVALPYAVVDLALAAEDARVHLTIDDADGGLLITCDCSLDPRATATLREHELDLLTWLQTPLATDQRPSGPAPPSPTRARTRRGRSLASGERRIRP